MTPKQKYFSNADWKKPIKTTVQNPQQQAGLTAQPLPTVSVQSGTQQTLPGTAKPSTSQNVTQVQKPAAQTQQASPTYQSQWQTGLDDTMNKILNREEFKFDLNGDALMNQYKDMYTMQGRQAMMDTMAQAAALTGGYGSSYAQNAGQQAFHGYLQQMNDRIPELYQLAMDKYQMEGQNLKDQYSMMADRESQDYGRYRDQVADSQWQQNFDYQKGRDEIADQRYDQEWQYQKDRDAISDQRYDQEWQYQQDRDAVEDQRYDQEFQYQQSRDEAADQKWQAEFDYQQGRDQIEDDRYNQEWEYQQGRDEIEDSRYDEQWQYEQDRDAIEDERYNQEWEYEQSRDQIEDERYNEQWEYEQGRDQIADEQWQAEFDEDKRRYDQEYAASNGGSGGSGGGSGGSNGGNNSNPTVSANDYAADMNAAKTEEEGWDLVEEMIDAGVPEEEAYALYYDKFPKKTTTGGGSNPKPNAAPKKDFSAIYHE